MPFTKKIGNIRKNEIEDNESDTTSKTKVIMDAKFKCLLKFTVFSMEMSIMRFICPDIADSVIKYSLLILISYK